ncbi:hypothetical protein [Vibrio maerlii]|uniref:hypothetical protein n=1 Tax=Vibrio maerlii TaxID=2231648 RepID=UPI000E3E2B13|nr:hypothetical protein [Vibrio maerlii]
MKSKAWLVGCSLLFASSVANADELQLSQDLLPMSEAQLSQYRGGFRFSNDYVVNIGLRVQTSINGKLVFHNQIAELVIENGALKRQPVIPTNDEIVQAVDDRLVNVVQVGEGNTIESTNGESIIPDSLVDITSEVESTIGSNVNAVSSTAIASNITNVIQNTLDNSVLGLSTIVDIDANVGEMLKQRVNHRRLQDALLIGQY